MIKRITHKEDAIICLKLRDDLYTVAQMRQNSLMDFFKISRPKPLWDGVDLNTIDRLFCAFTAESKLKPIIASILSKDTVIPTSSPVPRRMLSSIIEADYYGADLVELLDDLSSVNAKTIKKNLDPKKDLTIIHEHELTGMIGAPEKIKQRLLRYFETGVNWDDSKSFLFKGIALPSSTFKKS